MSSRLYKVRQWQRRLATIKRSAEELHSQAMDDFGVEGTTSGNPGGDIVTDWTDNVVGEIDRLENVLEIAARYANQKPARTPS